MNSPYSPCMGEKGVRTKLARRLSIKGSNPITTVSVSRTWLSKILANICCHRGWDSLTETKLTSHCIWQTSIDSSFLFTRKSSQKHGSTKIMGPNSNILRSGESIGLVNKAEPISLSTKAEKWILVVSTNHGRSQRNRESFYSFSYLDWFCSVVPKLRRLDPKGQNWLGGHWAEHSAKAEESKWDHWQGS